MSANSQRSRTVAWRSAVHANGPIFSLILLSLLIRLPLLFLITSGNATEGWDAAGYVERALGTYESVISLINGHLPSRDHLAMAYTSTWPPFQTLVLASGFLAFGPTLFGARLSMVIVSVLTVPFIYLVTRRFFDSRAAFLAGLIFILYPPFVHYSLGPRPETTFIFLLMVGIYVSMLLSDRITNDAPCYKLAIVLGITLALAALTRSAGIVLLPVILIWLIWGTGFIRRAYRPAALILFASLVTFAPWQIAVSAAEGRFIFLTDNSDRVLGLSDRCFGVGCPQQDTAGSQQSFQTDSPEIHNTPETSSSASLDRVTVKQSSKYQWAEIEVPWSIPLDTLLRHPLDALGYGVQHWWLIWGMEIQTARHLLFLGYPPIEPMLAFGIILSVLIAHMLVIAFAIIGLVYNGLTLRSTGLIALIFAASMGIHFLIGYNTRYHIPLIALLIPLAASGITYLTPSHFGMTWHRPVIAIASIISVWLVILTSTWTSFGAHIKTPSSYYAGVGRAIEPLIKGGLPSGDRFLLRLSGPNFPSELTLSAPGQDVIFQPGDSSDFAWRPASKPIVNVVTLGPTAAEPINLTVTWSGYNDRTHQHKVALDRNSWQIWQRIPSNDIEYMWVGGAWFPIESTKVFIITGDKPSIESSYLP